MRKTNVLGLIFPNMHEEALRDLTSIRALGSVPFAGRYRLIDFTLSNMVNAGVSKVGVVTKSNYQSLMDHLGSGKAWDLSRKNDGLYILPPFGTSDESYSGRVASLAGMEAFFSNSKEEYVVMSDCHVVANIDYSKLIEAHVASGADITVGYIKGELPRMNNTMTVQVDGTDRITDIAIVDRPEGIGQFGIGLYVLRKDLLVALVKTAVSRNQMHFERDILQRYVDELSIYGYEVTEQALVISSLASYYAANMAMLDTEKRAALFRSDRQIYTKVRDCCPAMYGLNSKVTNSLVADGAHVDGTVRNSIIFRNVKIAEGAVLENCIVMQGAVVFGGTSLDSVILDKNVLVKDQRSLKGFESFPIYIEKNSIV
ncbi:MAG: glucose-1-phosphate adenylyltransferase subunit GlgD [Ruminococcaceae bacterium]|nr:glucose-1-phosphate adenylyltransferase subunit GlgD [Oscillospiraceae bacterium]